MVAECLVLLDWGFTDAPPQIRCKSKLRLDNKFRFDLCEPGFPLTQSSIRFELANIRFNQLFNKLPTCSWVCSEYIFWKGPGCVLLNFIIFHRASQQRYLRNLTNFRNQANTSRLICYIFLPVCWRIQLRWGKELSKRKRGAFSIQPISILLQ